MAIKIKEKGEYKNIDFSDLEPNDSFEFTLKFDQPREHEGKWGKFYSFACDMHSPENIDNVGFIASGQSDKFGKKFADVLKEYKTGDRLKAKAGLKKGKMGFFTVWTVEAINASRPQNKSEDQQLIDELIRQSNNVTQSFDWVKQRLEAAGIKDDFIVKDIATKYIELMINK